MGCSMLVLPPPICTTAEGVGMLVSARTIKVPAFTAFIKTGWLIKMMPPLNKMAPRHWL